MKRSKFIEQSEWNRAEELHGQFDLNSEVHSGDCDFEWRAPRLQSNFTRRRPSSPAMVVVSPPTKVTTAGTAAVSAIEDRDWILAHLAELTAQYPDEVIAVLDCKVIGHRRSGRALRAEMFARNLEREPIYWFLEAAGRVYAG